MNTKGRAYDDLRWSRFKHLAAGEMYAAVAEHVFPFLRIDLPKQLGGEDSTYAHHMKDARFTIPTDRSGRAAINGLRDSAVAA